MLAPDYFLPLTLTATPLASSTSSLSPRTTTASKCDTSLPLKKLVVSFVVTSISIGLFFLPTFNLSFFSTGPGKRPRPSISLHLL